MTLHLPVFVDLDLHEMNSSIFHNRNCSFLKRYFLAARR